MKHFNEYIELFTQIINKFNLMNSKPHNYGIDVTLHPSEINILFLIHNNPNITLTIVAKKLGVTKSAISQALDKLEKKGCIVKEKKKDNKKTKILILTDKAEKAVLKYEEYKDFIFKELIEHYHNLSEEKLEFLYKVLEEVSNLFDKKQDFKIK